MTTRKQQQRGVGMVEILVALLVLAIGVLGYAGLQLNALKSTESAQIRSQGTALARDTLESILINDQERDTYLDEGSWGNAQSAFGDQPPSNPDCLSNPCSSAEMATWDIDRLQWQAGTMLPAGRLHVTPCSTGGVTTSCVVVAWGDQDIDECLDGGEINTGLDSECAVMEVER
ncbi:MAG: type IV pilus assembly protein PilV [Alloalcanivorax sp.]|jgi:type IV pilus assembly protein PilV|nr:type IV pilus modification protein PilV [Alcanivorax sp.]HIK75333.1 type IV pilus modification protein PilV [Alcanivorax sp.]